MRKIVVLLLVATSLVGSINAQDTFVSKLLKGKIYYTDKEEVINEKTWNPHPAFKGVFLKHLISGKETNNLFSNHVVKIEPHCILEEHIHDGKYELHEVIDGSGVCFWDGKEIQYTTGVVTVIPANTKHKVIAGKDGLYLLAKFSPAL